MRHADMWKTAITCWIWNAITHSAFSAKAWGEISNRSKLDHTVTVTFICHIISHFPTAISKTSIGLTAWMAHHKKEKRLQLIPCACHPDYAQGDHEVEDDPVAADGSAGTGLCAAACNSTKSTENENTVIHDGERVAMSDWVEFSKNRALKRTNAASAKLRRGW